MAQPSIPVEDRNWAIAALEERIADAQTRRDMWRAGGSNENYMEACGLVDALELQLERKLRQPDVAD